LHTFETKAFNT